MLMTNGSLMKVESIAECSPWSILQYFWPALIDNLSWKLILVFFRSGRLRQVLLYLLYSLIFISHLQISVIPQESVSSTEAVTGETNLPPTSSFLSLPAWGLAPPATSDPLSLPHFQHHYDNVKQHHEMLQQQLQQHIQQFLRQQEDSQGDLNSEPLPAQQQQREASLYMREPSIHWQPAIPETRQDDSSSRSYLFSSLR